MSIVTLLTLVGGLVIATRNVHSDRPNSSAEADFSSSEQRVQSRLWEDPLGWGTNQVQANGQRAFRLLQDQINARTSQDPRPTLLLVMIRGGPYSEDRESRIRSRIAIVSALGESGYAPEDAQHIGAVKFSWPTTAELRNAWITNQPCQFRINDRKGLKTSDNKLELAFEWYRSRTFNRNSDPSSEQRVLVLWLDEDQFNDYPLAGVALLVNELIDAYSKVDIKTITNLFERVALIGPRSSTTLRAMLPPYGQADYVSNSICPGLKEEVSNILHQVDVFCPISSAMDEVLVADSHNAPPRQPVERVLTNFWFHSFHNFCATDAQLAAEAFDELKLRQVDLSDPEKNRKNLVLISEWDTFYGRMLSLTYAAELAKMQHQCLNDIDFVNRYRSKNWFWPTNLFSFVYLRGLDGQTTRPAPPETAPPESSKLPSLEDLKHGDLNQNKAEGEAQFDYLDRLADRMQELDDKLKTSGQGRIDAIGMVGSDPYDTLVILQVLRPRFPDAVFFTTELDARYLHPKVQGWGRNLIVLSGYGLQLSEELQGSVAPFRDSAQTAQFAATLAALKGGKLLLLNSIPPRRFEIGRLHAYDLSVTNGGILHPLPLGQRQYLSPDMKRGFGLVLVCGGFMLICSWRTLQRLTWDRQQFEMECLWFQKEDLGGEEGIAKISKQLDGSDPDRLISWLSGSFAEYHARPKTPGSNPTAGAAELQRFLDFLNQVALQTEIPPEVVASSKYIGQRDKKDFDQALLAKQSAGVFFQNNSATRLRLNRRILSKLFLQLQASNKLDPDPDLAQVHHHSRRSGLEQYRLRRNWRRAIWIGGVLFAIIFCLLLRAALNDNVVRPTGEPLLFSAGISVWPTEMLRLAAFGLAIAFLANAYASLRSGIFDLTRRYRLPLARQLCEFKWRLPSTPAPQATVDAVKLWKHYQQLGRFWQRMGRIAPLISTYFLLCYGIGLLAGMPYRPVRGPISNTWDLCLLGLAILAFLLLAFWITDAARLCRWLIEHLSEAPTRYPDASLRFFAHQRGLGDLEKVNPEDRQLLAEWIDMQLIASLTERVGRLVYYPFIVFFVLLVSRNSWWDRWPWPHGLIIIFGLNLVLALASIIILQRAALKARETGIESLRTKVENAERIAQPSPEKNLANVGRRLLEEVQTLRKGAFAPFWENPIVGALLIPSGGTVLLELLFYLFGS